MMPLLIDEGHGMSWYKLVGKESYLPVVGGFNQPIWKNMRIPQIGSFSQNRDEHQKCLKPPPSYDGLP